MKKSLKLTMILVTGITLLENAISQNLCVNSKGDTKVASRCPRGFRAVLNLRNTLTEQKLANTPLVTSGSIQPQAVIGSVHIAPKSILGAQIGDGVIESRHVARIHASKIEGLPSFEPQPNSIDTQHLKDNAVTGAKIADGAVGDRQVSSISHTKIAWTGWTLPAKVVGEAQLLDDVITSEKIKNETIKNQDIAVDAKIAWTKIEKPRDGIPGSDIADNAITGSKVADGAITTAKLADGAVTNQKFSSRPEDRLHHSKVNLEGLRFPANSVNSDTITDGSIQDRDLADNSITSQKIANTTIRDEDIANNAGIAFSKVALPQGGIPGSSLAQATITQRELAENSVNSGKILNGSVQSDDLATDAVLSAKIKDGEVKDVDLAANSVNSSKIADGAVTSDDLASRAVTAEKIANGAISEPHLNLSTTFPFYHTFYNNIFLRSYSADPNGINEWRYYSISNNLLRHGALSGGTSAWRENDNIWVTTNNSIFKCRQFTLSVAHSTSSSSSFGSGTNRIFRLVGIAFSSGTNATITYPRRADDPNRDAELVFKANEPLIQRIAGVFSSPPNHLALEVRNQIAPNQSLDAGFAEVRITCLP